MKIDLQWILFPLMLLSIYVVNFNPSFLEANVLAYVDLGVVIIAWFLFAMSVLGMIAVLMFPDSQRVRASLQTTLRQHDTTISELMIKHDSLWSWFLAISKATAFWFYGDMMLFVAYILISLATHFLFMPALR